jgi:hypothetical protein
MFWILLASSLIVGIVIGVIAIGIYIAFTLRNMF